MPPQTIPRADYLREEVLLPISMIERLKRKAAKRQDGPSLLDKSRIISLERELAEHLAELDSTRHTTEHDIQVLGKLFLRMLATTYVGIDDGEVTGGVDAFTDDEKEVLVKLMTS